MIANNLRRFACDVRQFAFKQSIINMKIISSAVTSPAGFKANGLSAKIKRSGKPDLALIYSDVPCSAAAVFTTNSVKAAPLIVSQKHIANNKIQAIVINSGNANCFTGHLGRVYALKTTQLIGKLLNIPKEDVLVCSTGIIGKPLPYHKIEDAAPALVEGLSKERAHEAALAILTTDLATKELAVELKIDGKTVRLGACAKGSGMTAPNMATMLAFITTDCSISPAMLKHALKKAVNYSFNRISVDGCMSTNDMVTVMANGLAKNKTIVKEDKDFETFYKGLYYICHELAKKIVLDGEGATKFIEITVNAARNEEQAKAVGMAIANSNLVKTAAFGSDPNWGRVAAAVGSLGIKDIKEDNLKINFSSFKKKHITINVDLGVGKHKATVYTSDLSYEYVRINGEYN